MVKHHDDEEYPICPKHSGIETWVKIGMGGIGLNVLLLVVNILLNFTLNASVASMKTSIEGQERRLSQIEAMHARK